MNDVLRVFAAIAKPPLEGSTVGRQDKDADRVRQRTLDLSRTLYIDVEQKVMAVASGIAQELPGRSVTVPVDVGIFEELPSMNHPVARLHGDAMILLAIRLAAARGSRSIRARELKAGA